MLIPVLFGLLFFVAILVAVFAVKAKPSALEVKEWGPAFGKRLQTLWTPTGAEMQDIRMAGTTKEKLTIQRFSFLVVGLIVGAVLGYFWQGLSLAVFLLGLVGGLLGWILPALAVRNKAKSRRNDAERVIRLWIVLAAQQVTAGMDPAPALLHSSAIGTLPTWKLLRWYMLDAQFNHQPLWDGLRKLDRDYGLRILASMVSALSLATDRGTRVSNALIAAGDLSWRSAIAAEEEQAARSEQIVVMPSTLIGVSLAVALVYPPMSSLTSGLSVA